MSSSVLWSCRGRIRQGLHNASVEHVLTIQEDSAILAGFGPQQPERAAPRGADRAGGDLVAGGQLAAGVYGGQYAVSLFDCADG